MSLRHSSMRALRIGAALALACSLSGCFNALKNIGSPPPLSPVSGPRQAIDPSLPRPGFDGDPHYMAESAGGRGGKGIPKPRGAPDALGYPSRPPAMGAASYGGGAIETARTGARSASLYRPGGGSLYQDKRARYVGDPVTVMIDISDSASVNASSSRTRETSATIGAPTVFGLETLVDRIIPGDAVGLSQGATAQGGSEQTGNGSTARDESISARIAATVVEVLPNGHLVIAGSQEVRVNFELRDVQIVGVIRPSDISRDNTITYDRIASARISIGGDGPSYAVTGQTYGEAIVETLRPF